MNYFYCSLHFCFRLTGYNSQPACYWLVSALVFCDHGDLTEVLQCLEEEFQQQLGSVAGMELFSFGTPPLPGSDAGLPVSFVIASTAPYEEVYRVGEELLKRARESGQFIFVTQSLNFDRPEVQVNIDRELSARLGISMRDIGQTLATIPHLVIGLAACLVE